MMTVRGHSDRNQDHNAAGREMLLRRRNTHLMPHSTEFAPHRVDSFLLYSFHGKGSLVKRSGQRMSSDMIIAPIDRLDSLPI